MKQLAIVVTVLVFGGVAYLAATKTSTPVEYVAPEVQTVEKEVRVDALEQEIKNAQDGKMSEIKASAQAAYDEAYSQEMKKVELEVIKSFNSKLNERQIQLEKDTKQY